MEETWIQSLGQESHLDQKMAAYFSILAWRILWTEEPGGLESLSSKESDTTEQLTLSYFLSLELPWWLKW